MSKDQRTMPIDPSEFTMSLGDHIDELRKRFYSCVDRFHSRCRF